VQGCSACESALGFGARQRQFHLLDTSTHLFLVDDDFRDRLDADFLAAEQATSNVSYLSS